MNSVIWKWENGNIIGRRPDEQSVIRHLISKDVLDGQWWKALRFSTLQVGIMKKIKCFTFLSLIILPLLSSAVTLTVDYSYDNLGRLISASYSTSNAIAYNYDPAGNLISQTFQLQDIDGDGIVDSIDNCPDQSNADQLDTDGDSLGNVCDSDDDNDGLPDVWENANTLNPLDPTDALQDADMDGVTNLDEYRVGTDPQDNLSNPDSINLALDTKAYNWTISGDARWHVQKQVTRVGDTALQSGSINDFGQSNIEVTITGPTPVSFYWKVSSELDADYLSFYIDDMETYSISGEVDWQRKTVNLSSGSHILRWTYSKDGNNSSGSDAAWLDGVSIGNRNITPILFLLF